MVRPELRMLTSKTECDMVAVPGSLQTVIARIRGVWKRLKNRVAKLVGWLFGATIRPRPFQNGIRDE